MKYSKLVELYEYLEKTPARLKKVERIAEFFRGANSDELGMAALLVQGKVFPSYSEKEIGLADRMMARIIASSTGFPEKDVVEGFRETGDLGLVVENLMKKKKQTTLLSRDLTVEKVFSNLRKLASIEGKGTQTMKISLVKELITNSTPREAKYIVRTAISQLRIGVAEGVLRDSVAEAFFPGKDGEERKKVVSAIEWAWFLRPDYSEISRIAKERGMAGLEKIKVEVGKPYHVLLAEKSSSLEEAVAKFEKPGIEFKYDGARVCIHKKGEKFWFYTRRLEDITKQFPDLLDVSKKCVKAGECIIEGEMLAINPKNGKPFPFQMLSQRIKRKYGIERLMEEIPVQVNVFDAVYHNGRQLFSETLERRRKILGSITREIRGKFQLAEILITKDIGKAEEFYRRALRENHEGVIVKNLGAKYQPGRRVGYWLKVKPIMETLDLVITGAEWGTGKRAKWFGTFVLSCKNDDEFVECGMMGTGIKEKGEGVTFEDMTKQLEPLVESSSGKSVRIKPKIVVEVAYEEIQKSPNYSSGFALRFPRLLRVRPDKSPYDADGVKKIEKLYAMQKGKRA